MENAVHSVRACCNEVYARQRNNILWAAGSLSSWLSHAYTLLRYLVCVSVRVYLRMCGADVCGCV